jgi:DNA-binding NarL/FixJ family response regulator
MTTASERPPRTTRPRVLIVDDHALLAESLATWLAEGGYEVATLDTFRRDAIINTGLEWNCDIVLLDLLVGNDGGITTPLIEPLREYGIDVVVLTGADDPKLLRESLDAGATAVMRKSCRMEEIFDVLDLVVEEDIDALSRAREQLRAELSTQLAENDAPLAPFERLTRREQDVLAALVDGLSPDEIAADSSVSIATVRSHIHSVLEKLSVHSQVAAVSLAVRTGWAARHRI